VRVQSMAFVFGRVKVASIGQRARRGRREGGHSMPFLLMCILVREELRVHENTNANLGMQGGSIVSHGQGYGVTWRRSEAARLQGMERRWVEESDGVLANPGDALSLRVSFAWSRVAWREGKGKETPLVRTPQRHVPSVLVPRSFLATTVVAILSIYMTHDEGCG
jgi:hypothetical protein